MQEKTVQGEPKGKTVKKKAAFAKYTAKDSVFTTIFQDKKYLIQLYRALHPEDTVTTEDALTDITIRNVLTNGIYNDLCFRVGDKVMFLVEQQSSWTMNIIIRVLIYLAQTYHDYFEEQGVLIRKQESPCARGRTIRHIYRRAGKQAGNDFTLQRIF